MPPARGRPLSLFWAKDEELAKKNDDLHTHNGHRHAAQGRGNGHWQSAHLPRRRRFLIRLALYTLFLLGLAAAFSKLFLHRGRPHLERWTPGAHSIVGASQRQSDNSIAQKQGQLLGSNSDSTGGTTTDQQTYSAPVKFPFFAASLQRLSQTGGAEEKNRNVLFTTASVHGASTLLPLACDMAKKKHSYVHFVMMGRSSTSLQDLLQLNGVDSDCPMFMHDARPDHGSDSTQERMAASAVRAFLYIKKYMHPQAVFVDSTLAEEQFFLDVVRRELKSSRPALIELPENPRKNFSWLTNLDASALASWHSARFDILIQAAPGDSANLIRLLKSLSKADLSTLTIPQLTIELPPTIEPSLESFLVDFQWPPGQPTSQQQQLLSLRHRIPQAKLTPEESSVRFLESFWPSKPFESHVLVLSAHDEVTPEFFSYVKYSLLHYRYSEVATSSEWVERMLGLSFASPGTFLDGTTAFSTPQMSKEDSRTVPFLWQAPNSDAMLFIGDKWTELHSLTSGLIGQKSAKDEETPELLQSRKVSKQHPAWLENVLWLCRLRGYYSVYPGKDISGAILGVHSDLYDTPEEHRGDDSGNDEDSISSGQLGDRRDKATRLSQNAVDLLSTLPNDGVLPRPQKMPLLSWDGYEIDLQGLQSEAKQLAAKFRVEVGGCSEEEAARRAEADNLSDSLFC